MKKILAFLLSALLAALLCGSLSAPGRKAAAAGERPSFTSEKKKPVGKKKGAVRKRGAAKKPEPAGAPGALSPFSTPPPGTGYGNLDPAPAPAGR